MKANNIRNLIASISASSHIRAQRNYTDLLADRIRIAANEPTIVGFINRLMALMQSSPEEVHKGHLGEVLRECADQSAQSKVLAWMRENSAIAAMLAMMKKEDALDALDSITIEGGDSGGQAPARRGFDVNLTIRATSPVSHGSDIKAGNCTLFRRMQVISTTGNALQLPYISGNSLRGQLRDIIADHLLESLGIEARRDAPAVELWFFHAIYSGGVLSEGGKEAKSLDSLFGANGALRTDGLREFRDTLPMLSLLGCALQSRIISGRVNIGDLRPRCYEWGTGETPVHQCLDWIYLTRREDHEGHEDGQNSSMIANTEVLKPGVEIEGGIDLSKHISDLEASCLGLAIRKWMDRGYIGAQSARGVGRFEVVHEDGVPDPSPYESWIMENKDKVLGLLRNLGALVQ